jgi:hypothetical protein
MLKKTKRLSNDKKVAWNGIRIILPGSWQPVVIDPFHLLFEDDSGPTIEIRWSRHKQNSDVPSIIYRKLQQTAGSYKCKIQENSIPKAWKEMLGRYEIKGFRWHSTVSSAKGLVLHCPICRTVTLLQFHQTSNRVDDKLIERILSTFDDHQENNTTHWAMYDIKADLPSRFELIKHHFSAGAFQLDFKAKATRVSLYRFAPASILLSDISLYEFALLRWPVYRSQPLVKDISSINGLEYQTCPETNFYTQTVLRLLGRRKEAWLRIRHIKGPNRILAFRAEGHQNHIKELVSALADKFSHV